MEKIRFKIKSLVYEVTDDDGTTEDIELSNVRGFDDLGYIKLLSASPSPGEIQKFWLASNHDGMTAGTHVLASALPGTDVDRDVYRDMTNTMIGLVRDGACTAYVVYTPDEIGLLKKP